MKYAIIMMLAITAAGDLFASDSGAYVQNELHYKVKKNIAGPDEIIVEGAELCDPKEQTRMPFFN